MKFEYNAEKLSRNKITFAFTFLAQMRMGHFSFGIPQIASKLALQLPNSREIECEADYIGLQLMRGASFDVNEAPKFW